MPAPVIAVVILNYNGKALLQQFLPSVLEHSAMAEVYVADNASTDGSLEFLQKEYPHVKLVKLPQNYGFAQGYNEALKFIRADYFILLNSDVEVTQGWITPVIDLMESDKKIAACQPKILAFSNKDEFEYAGACGGFIDTYGYPFCRGRIFNTLEKDHGQYNDVKEIFWATGACMFVRAEVYKGLSGFDGSYFAHMEEIDLCWRMKNTGYSIMAVPLSIVYHLGGGTLHKLSPRKTFLNFRNNLVTLTKNYPSGIWPLIIFARLVLDGIAGMKFLVEGRLLHTFAVLKAHFAFYFSLPRVLRQRSALKKAQNYVPQKKQFYKGNIVLDHYLKKIKHFSQLNSAKFNA